MNERYHMRHNLICTYFYRRSVLELPKIVQFGDKYPVGLVQNGESLPRAQFEQVKKYK